MFGEPSSAGAFAAPGVSSYFVSLGTPGTISEARNVSPFTPKRIAGGHPMIQTKGIYPGRNNQYYITDTGKDGSHKEPGKVWRFDANDKSVTLFYESDRLINPKWLFYYTGSSPDEDRVIVSDYGEEPVPRQPGTGVGAKVMSIPVLADGKAGDPKILHEGAPLRSPEGVTVIGKTVILADWAAGDLVKREGKPDAEYLSGVVFSLPLEGGTPVPLFPEKKWVTLIGACQFFDEKGDLYLRLIDIDGGRLDTAFPALPQSGVAAFWTAKVLSQEPLSLAEPQKVTFTEDFLLKVAFADLNLDSQSTTLTVQLAGAARFEDGTDSQTLSTEYLRAAGGLSLVVKSPLDDVRIDVKLVQRDRTGAELRSGDHVIEKDLARSVVPFDNKHGGASRMQAFSSGGETGALPFVLTGSADGTGRSVFLFPPGQTTPAVLWQGDPLVSPMGVQFAADGLSLYVTDQSAEPDGTSALFEILLPSQADLRAMFPAQGG